MSRRKESLSYLLVNVVPWWVSVLLAVVLYAVMKWVAPLLFQEDKILGMIMKGAPGAAWIAFLIFLPMALLSAWTQFCQRWAAPRNGQATPTNAKPKRKRA